MYIRPSTLIRFNEPQPYTGITPFQGHNGIIFTNDYTLITGRVCDSRSLSYNSNKLWKIYCAHSTQFKSHAYIQYENEDAHILILSPNERVREVSASTDHEGVVMIHVTVYTLQSDNENSIERELTLSCKPEEAAVVSS